MRLEVLVDNGEPKIYPLNKSEILIGSGETSDIIISYRGVSRRHLKVTILRDQYFVTDQGSTNGTFINEERLIPGRRIEFTSFFPVRLGNSVLLSLLSDEEAESSLLRDFIKEDSGAEDSSAVQTETKVISLKELRNVRTDDLVKKRKAVITKKRSRIEKRREKNTNRMFLPGLLAFLILGIGYYLNETNKNDLSEKNLNVPKKIEKTPSSATMPEERILPPPEDIPREKLQTYFYGLKCILPEELEFCNTSDIFKEKLNGVSRVGNSFIILIEETDLLKNAIEGLPPKRQGISHENEPVLRDQTYKLALLDFLLETGMELKKFGKNPFYFVFYRLESDKPIIGKVVSLNSSNHEKMMEIYNAKAIRSIKRYGFSSIIEIENFIKSY